MVKAFLKKLLLAVVSVGALGALSWYLFQRLVMQEPISDSAMKVLGWVWRM
jgi:hypothetical protein